MMELPRINQYLVSVNLAPSRRKADELIKARQVNLNGSVLTELGYRVKPTDSIEINGQAGIKREHIYIVYNKPIGQVCSHKHQGQSQTIFDNLPDSFISLKLAGRLDKDSRGLIVLSSDGEFIQQLSHPSNNKSKSYIVTTKQVIPSKSIELLNAGISLEDGISKLSANKIRPKTIRIEMGEGRNRQIRRTLQAVGLDVIDLVRVSIAKYSNPHLAEGKFEFVKPGDIL